MEQIENYVQELNNNSQAGAQIPQERSVMEQQVWGAPRLRQWCGGRLLAPAAHMSSGSLCLPPARMHLWVLQRGALGKLRVQGGTTAWPRILLELIQPDVREQLHEVDYVHH